MRTTITLDDELLDEAMRTTGITEKSKLMAYALKELVRQKVTERFLALEGTMPELNYSERIYRHGREPFPKTVLNDSDE